RQRVQQLGVKDASIERHLEKIAAEVQRSNKTINDLLELARNRPPKRRLFSAATLVAQAVSAAHLPPGAEVSGDAPEEATVDGDPDQLARVLSNLFINASQAMGGKGQIRVAARRVGDQARLRVQDDGPGVAADVRHKIFEALFTTKAKGSGL